MERQLCQFQPVSTKGFTLGFGTVLTQFAGSALALACDEIRSLVLQFDENTRGTGQGRDCASRSILPLAEVREGDGYRRHART